MHSSECPVPQPVPSSGPALLLELGRLIVRARAVAPAASQHDRLLQAKLLALNPSTSQVQTQPKPETDEPRPAVEAQLSDHVQALWNEQIPICIEVLLAPDCVSCYKTLCRVDAESSYDRQHTTQRALLLERWTMQPSINKSHEAPAFITSQWLLNAVRSQLHFSQLSAWLARLKKSARNYQDPTERRRKLSREKCNFKKLEANCDEEDLSADDPKRKLNIVYSIKIPGESYKMSEFCRPPTDHMFPLTDIGNNISLKVVLESLPRVEDIPFVKCSCKRRSSKDMPPNVHEDLAGKFNDLTLGPRSPKNQEINSNIGNTSRRLSIVSNSGSTEYQFSTAERPNGEQLVDDRMHTPCSENGKHKCSCDDESDGKEKENRRSSTSFIQEPKKLDERRLKEIAKYKRRLRKENKLKKLSDSTSSEGDNIARSKETTSIPILQASRFDRFRAIGCYRNQTYLTLPASRTETRSPFIDTMSIPPAEFKKTCTVSTQTDEVLCDCGTPLQLKCQSCSDRGMVRSEANYDLASLNSDNQPDKVMKCQEENGARRKCEDDEKSSKKHKCDNNSSKKCDISFSDSFSGSDKTEKKDEEEFSLIKRPKLRRFFPIVDRIEKIVSDRFSQKSPENRDMKELHLNDDDTVFIKPENSKPKRQKTYSISDDDYVLYEKCDYGTFDKNDMDSPKDCTEEGFKFPDVVDIRPKEGQDTQVPSPTEMDKFRWRFDSAASMVFHSKTGLPLTSSPAPLRRGNNCFDFDDSINGISGIKSALFHPIPSSSPGVASPPSPRPAAPRVPAPQPSGSAPKLKIGPSTGLLGSFEESALKGRLEPVATVAGFSAELGASGAFCPPHRRLPVTVFFYAPGGTNAPYMGHINLGGGGYQVPGSGTVQVSLFNPHGTLVKMFVVLYDLTAMPPMARTFLRQRTLYMPVQAGSDPPERRNLYKWLRYLIHLRFMTSKSGKLYLHTDIRIIVSRKADLDTATAHSTIFRPLATNESSEQYTTSPVSRNETKPTNDSEVPKPTNDKPGISTNHAPNRFFGGCGEFSSEMRQQMREIGYENRSGVSYELRSFTYAPENPRFSPR